MLKELKTVGPRVGSTPGLNETEEEGGLMSRGPGPLSKEQCFPQGGETIRFMLCKDLPGSSVYTSYIV